MMTRVWILILAKRGFIQEPQIFYNKRSANSRKRVLLEDFNPDYDEIEVFEKVIHI